MGSYRPIYKKIWKDPDFQNLAPEGKLLFVYLCTNESTTESGIYPITPKTIANETGLNIEIVCQLLSNGNVKNIKYDDLNQLVFVKKLRRYNTGGKPELVRRSIQSDYNLSSYSPLWVEFTAEYPDIFASLNTSNNKTHQLLTNPLPTVTKPLTNPLSTMSNSAALTKRNLTKRNYISSKEDSSDNSLLAKDLRKYPIEFTSLRRRVFSELKQRRGYVSRQPAAEAKAISELLLEKFTVSQILEAYDLMRKQPFFLDKSLSMMQVKKDIYEVLNNGKHQKDTPRSLPTTYTEPEEL